MKTGILILITWLLVSCGPPLPSEGQSPYYGYSISDVNYFWEIGLCFELSNCLSPPRVQKWNSQILIQMHGQYTTDDEKELNDIIQELSQLTGLSIAKTTSGANINIYFVHQQQFKTYCVEYNPNNVQNGFFEISSSSNVISRSSICIEGHLQEEMKHHLLREELTQSLGLGSDSNRYVDSIFQQNPQYQVTEYAEIDKQVIKLLYDQRVKPGMTQQEIDHALRYSHPTHVTLLSNK